MDQGQAARNSLKWKAIAPRMLRLACSVHDDRRRRDDL
jgi:hypothetical protein